MFLRTAEEPDGPVPYSSAVDLRCPTASTARLAARRQCVAIGDVVQSLSLRGGGDHLRGVAGAYVFECHFGCGGRSNQNQKCGGSQSGDARTGAGGHNGEKPPGADAKLAQALRKELLEAASDTPGENVNKDDLRRKTEQGKSAITYSGAGMPVTFDPSHASAPPPVPEARRSLVQSYFVRKSP